MAPYSEVSDMEIGDIIIPDYIGQEKILVAAADEIDAAIGFLYETPVNIDEATSTVVRPARLLLKRISVYISSGRTLLALSAGSEDNRTHAYGRYLLNQGLELLKKVASGELILEGAPRVDNENPEPNGPLIFNVDAESSVEAFYSRATTPTYPGQPYPSPYPYQYRPAGG
jgi:hypothetical protein